MNWNDINVVVTGAGGFVGSHLTERLVQLGAKAKAFVRYNSRNDWGLLELLPPTTLSEIEIIPGDLRDSDAVRRTVQNAEVVFHLGALIAIPYSYVFPRDAIETNITGTLNVLTAARENDIQRVIHTSTSEVYGTAQYVPIDESHPLQGQSPYSASKIAADMMAESFYRSFGVEVSIIRPFNVYGPRQSARAVIPTIVSQVLTSEQILLGSLHPTRDYTYVLDTVRAFIQTAESDDSIGKVVNIGSNFEISIGDIARMVLSITGKDLEIICRDERIRPEKSEVERLWCDNLRAKNLINWSPETGFEQGLRNTIEWISTNMRRYKSNIYNV